VSQLKIDDPLVLRVARRLGELRAPSRAVAIARATAAVPKPGGRTELLTGASAERLLRDQPELLAFVLAGTGQLSPESRAVGVFLGEVIFETFRMGGRETRAVRPQQFVASLRENRDMALRVGQAHDRIAERYLRNSNTLRQPALIRYVTGVLLEEDASCPHQMPRDELGPLFIVLKSVIDVLDLDSAAAQVPAMLSSEPA
jgi:hypothetical protein